MKLVCPVFALAFAAAVADAFRVEVSDVAPPADILGEHQELERTFTIYSEDPLEKLSIGIAGPVFVGYDESLLHPVVPTPEPTTPEPTETPTVVPTEAPTELPTEPPTELPTEAPTELPTEAPTELPTEAPTELPTEAPTELPTEAPTELPTEAPTKLPTEPPTEFPTEVPTELPTEAPTEAPTELPTESPVVPSVINITEFEGSSSGVGSSSDDSVTFPDGAVALRAASHKEKLVATVTISGNSSDLLNLVDVVSYKKDENSGIRLVYKNKDAVVEGYVLTQIQLAEKRDLRHLSTTLASIVNVLSDVLTKDTKKSIKVAVEGVSNVFIAEDSDIEAKNVDLDVAGTGSIQFVATSLKLDGELSTSLAGTGSLALHANSIESKDLKTSVSGSGSLFVIAKTLKAEDFSSSVYGSAFASIIATESGRVENEQLTAVGSGVVYAGSIVANKSNVDVWGSGQAYVQVTEKLKTSVSYSGKVYYVGAEPAVVKNSGWYFWRSQVVHADEDKSISHTVVESPVAYPEYLSIELIEAHHDSEPRVKIVDSAQPIMFVKFATHLAKVAHGPNGFLIFGSVGVGIVAVAMAAHSYEQHRVRRHYTPLV